MLDRMLMFNLLVSGCAGKVTGKVTIPKANAITEVQKATAITEPVILEGKVTQKSIDAALGNTTIKGKVKKC